MARRRGRHEGTIYFDRQRQRWRGTIMLGYRADGRPARHSVSGRTRMVVQRKLADLARDAALGTLPDAAASRLTVADYLVAWLRSKEATVRPRTWQRYEELVSLHLIPSLGTTRLAALRPAQVQALYSAKLRDGLAPQTVLNLHRLLRQALSQAVKWDYLTRNITDAVEPPTVARYQPHTLSVPEAQRLLAAATEDRWGPLWVMALTTGARLGELLALQWDDVDMSQGTVTIRRTLQAISAGEPVYGQPKSVRGYRVVPLIPLAQDGLRRQRAWQDEDRQRLGGDYEDYGLVFARRTGWPVAPPSVSKRLRVALRRVGLPVAVRFHDLRHTTGSLLIASGADVAAVAAILGHSQTSVTLDVYSHALPEAVGAAMCRLQRVLAIPGSDSTHIAPTQRRSEEGRTQG